MSPAAWYIVAKDFAGPLATSLAAATAAYITYNFQKRQLEIAKNKLKLDLFEKKYVIFRDLDDLLSYVISAHFQPSSIDGTKIRDLRRSLDEARFLCDPLTLAFIQTCDVACEDLIMFIATKEPVKDEPRSHFAEQASVKTARLRSLYEEVSYQFERELRIETPR